MNLYSKIWPSGSHWQGEAADGFDVERALESTPKMFRGGEAELDLVQTYASGDMAVLVAIERQHGEVAGLPDQAALLRGQINNGKLTGRVPSAATLAQQHDVAKGTAERALAIQRDEGLIRSVTGRGHFVVPAAERG